MLWSSSSWTRYRCERNRLIVVQSLILSGTYVLGSDSRLAARCLQVPHTVAVRLIPEIWLSTFSASFRRSPPVFLFGLLRPPFWRQRLSSALFGSAQTSVEVRADLGALGPSHQEKHVGTPSSRRGTLSVLWCYASIMWFVHMNPEVSLYAHPKNQWTTRRPLLSATWSSRHKGAIDAMRRQIKEIEEGVSEPKHEDGGALLRNLVLKHSTNGTGGLDNRKTFSDKEIVTQVNGWGWGWGWGWA